MEGGEVARRSEEGGKVGREMNESQNDVEGGGEELGMMVVERERAESVARVCKQFVWVR